MPSAWRACPSRTAWPSRPCASACRWWGTPPPPRGPGRRRRSVGPTAPGDRLNQDRLDDMNREREETEGRPGVLDRVAGRAVLGLAALLGDLPPRLGDGLGAALGTLGYLLDAPHRRRAAENLLRAGVAADAAAGRRPGRPGGPTPGGR